jgi:predicted nucleic acid-binding protein
MGVTPALRGRRVGLDTVAFIYFIEEHPDYLPLIQPLFEAADDRKLEIVTSALTLLEVLVVPYRAGDLTLSERYETLLTRARGITLVDIDRAQLRSTAQLRARYKVATPDAFQLAAALSYRCDTFVTNDRRLPTIPGLDMVQLRELLR